MKKHFQHKDYLFLLLFLIVQTAYTQIRTNNSQDPREIGRPSFFDLSRNQTLSQKSAPEILKEYLSTSINDHFEKIGFVKADAKYSQEKYQQFYKGIKVEYGVYNVNSRDGVVQSIGGEYYQLPETNTVPSISEASALNFALNNVKAKKYMWEDPAEEQWLKQETGDANATFFPKAELVICKDYFNTDKNQVSFRLAYKFNIYSKEPVGRSYIYVDAERGKIIHQDAIIKHVNGTAQTRYSGTRTIGTELSGVSYRLHDMSRGQGVETYNLNRGSSYSLATEFTDNDNNWTSAEFSNSNKDDAALDAHWASMMTYDYFKNVHGRNSFDGNGAKIKSYVHYSTDYINAFWNGSVMTYGDGGIMDGRTVYPLTAIDVGAHEIGHAVCSSTANLVYSYESGALNEGLSDIWGATVEYYADSSKSTWTVGEDMNYIIRSMSNPNEYQNPDTYLGTYWYTGSGDNGGVHTNSGVLNHWYYILVMGKSGTNDNGDDFNVTGIGIDKASKIVYRMESIYLTSNSQYVDARRFSIRAASDLYGPSSNEVLQTTQAWEAVGVYDLSSAPFGLTATAASTTQINLNWFDNSTDETGFIIQRSNTTGSGFVSMDTVTANTTSFANMGLITDRIYYYRVCALKGQVKTAFSNEASAIVGNGPLMMSDTTITTCNAVFLDPGGAGNYNNNQNITMTFIPNTSGNKVQVAFSSFNLEYGFDFLYIYDGASISAPLLGSFTGSALPPTLTATNAEGKLTLRFYSDPSVVSSGWQATIGCAMIPLPPTNLTATPTSSTQINLSWTDHSSNETGFKIERSFTPSANYSQIAEVAANITNYQDTALFTNNTYYYRVRAHQNGLPSAYSNESFATVGIPPVIMSNTTMTTCSSTLLDPGGTGNYGNSSNVVMTLVPATPGNKIKIKFQSFNTEYFYDHLNIYDGANVNAPLLGTFSGSTIPNEIYATNTDGKLTLSFISNSSIVSSGWIAEVSCIVLPAAPSSLVASAVSATQIDLSWTDNSNDETEFSIERSFKPQSGYTTIGVVSSNVRTYSDMVLSTNNIYYYRVAALKSGTRSAYSNTASDTVGTAPIRMFNGTVTTCNAIFEDAGGPDYYDNNESYTLTFNPGNSGDKIRAIFQSFQTEYNDVLYVYDGQDTSAPLIGSYSGYNEPLQITATNTSGKLTFVFSSNSTNVYPGWSANISCVTIPTAPGGLLATGVSTTQVNLSWTDYSNNETGFAIERSLNPSSNFTQIGTNASNQTSYSDTSLTTNNVYYYRIRAFNNLNFSTYSNVDSAKVGNPPITMSNASYTTCSATFLDPGGNDNYGNNQTFTTTFTPSVTGNKIKVSFSSFALESGFDYLTIYDGPTTSSPSLGSYSGQTIPSTFYANNSLGQLTFAFHSDGSVTYPGWQAAISCVDSIPLADLVIKAASVNFSSIPAGNSVGFSYTIENQGGTTATASDVRVFLSSDSIYQNTDLILSTLIGSSLNPGANSNRYGTFTIPTNTAAGNYYILFIADPVGSVAEDNETNNLRYFSVNVITPTKDLTISNPSIFSPVASGESFTASSYINNLGNSTCSTVTIGYYLSADTLWNSSDILLGNISGASLLGNSSSYKYSILTLPDSTSPGNYYVLFYADYSDLVTETNESNNIAAHPITVEAPSYDLNIQYPYSPSSIIRGHQVNLSCEINNQGNSAVSSSEVGFYLSTDDALDSADSLLGIAVGGLLSRNQQSYRSGSFTIPSTTAPGNYYILYLADPNDQVEEEDEVNNLSSVTITVETPSVDLLVNNTSLNRHSISAGQSLTASCYIYNIGNISSNSSDVGFYLSNDTAFDSTDVFLETVEGYGLYPGSYNYKFTSLQIPSNTSVGDYYIIFLGDNTNKEAESNENNNYAFQSITVVVQGSDYYMPAHGTETLSTCSATIYDDGGEGNYSNSANGILTLLPSNPGSEVRLTFSLFSLESCCDNLRIYDGNSTSSPLLGSYTSNPGVITSTHGALTLLWSTDGSVTYQGFEAQVSCISSQPDLLIATSSISPGTIDAGTSTTINSYLVNSGSMNTTSSDMAYYLSSDVILDTDDVLLASTTGGAVSGMDTVLKTQLITIPSTTAQGDYYVIIYADYNDNVIEVDESNNDYALPITVHSAKPDLLVTSSSISTSSVSAGSSTSITFSMANNGSVNSTSSDVGYYLSTDNNLDMNDVLLTSTTGGAISPMDSVITTTSVTIPLSTSSGNYYLILFADYSEKETELNESNNYSSTSITVSNPKPDLLFNSLQLSKSRIVAGDTLKLTAEIKNQSSVNADSLQLGFYLSTNETYDNSDKILGYLSLAGFSANSSKEINKIVTIPLSAGEGNYSIIFYIDDQNKIAEESETNNFGTAPLKTSIPNFDLKGEITGDTPTSLELGKQFDFNFKVTNLGNTLSTASEVTYFLSLDDQQSTGDMALNSSSIPSIDSSASVTFDASIIIPSTLSPGEYYLLFKIDRDKLLNETNKDNNLTFQKVTLIPPTGTDPITTTKQPDIVIFPNPTNGRFEFEIADVTQEKIEVSIVNSLGNVVDKRNLSVNSSKAKNLYKLNVASGAYILKAQIGNAVYYKKIIIE